MGILGLADCSQDLYQISILMPETTLGQLDEPRTAFPRSDVGLDTGIVNTTSNCNRSGPIDSLNSCGQLHPLTDPAMSGLTGSDVGSGRAESDNNASV